MRTRSTSAALTVSVTVAATLGLAGPAGASAPASPVPAASPAARTATLDPAFGATERSAALAAAQGDSARVVSALGLAPTTRLSVSDVARDASGARHVRYHRTLAGLPVLGGDLVVHQTASGAITGTEVAASGSLALDTSARTLTSARIGQLLAGRAKAGERIATATKVVWAVTGVPRLAFLTTLDRSAHGAPMTRNVVVDAKTGKQIQAWDREQTVDNATGQSLYSGTVRFATVKQGTKWVMKDTTRGNGTVVDVKNQQDPANGYLAGTIFSDPDNAWGNGLASNRQTAATDVAFGVSKTWDYYKTTFSRNGIANDGVGSKSRVHYAQNYDNAFWDDGCFCMTYGDGGSSFKPLVGLDVAGHEMTHGITSRSAGLYYFGDPGGLNESNSDIFGTMVEFYANTPSNPGNYRIGEQIVKPGSGRSYLRTMEHPSLDGVSYDCWSIDMGLDDPHYTSGPGNHWFYLLSEGSGTRTINGITYTSPTCNGSAVTGITRAKAAAIQYRAITVYDISTTSYLSHRDNTIRSAIDLYGTGSLECNRVAAAWDAVGVPADYWTCNGALDEGADTFGAGPGFETNRTLWTTGGQSRVTNDGAIGLPRTGTWFGLLNYAGATSNGTISRTIKVPNTATAKLRFNMLLSIAYDPSIGFTDGSGTVDVKVNGQVIPNNAGHFDQGYANNTYIRWDIPVNKWKGKTVTLSITGHEDAPFFSGYGYFQVLLDDFTLTPR